MPSELNHKPDYLPGYTPVQSVTIHHCDGRVEHIQATPEERYVTIGTTQGGKSGMWLVFDSKTAHPFRWDDVAKVEIEHLPVG